MTLRTQTRMRPQRFQQRGDIEFCHARPRLQKLATFVACLAFLAMPPSLLADTHYVSNTGSNTYPYDSWATATDSILLAVDAAAEWDTVRLAAGTYTADTIGLKKGLAFIGAGRDSTDIFHNGNDIQGIYLVDSCLLQGIYLHGRTDTSASGIVTFHLVEGVLALEDQSALVRDCRFSDIKYCIRALWTDRINPDKRVVVENSDFSSFYAAVEYWFCSSVVRGNAFHVNYNDIANAVWCWYNTAEVRGNTFIRTVPFSSPAIKVAYCDSIWIANNICLSILDTGVAIIVNSESPGYPTHGVVENNLCMGGWGGIYHYGGDTHIRNNIVEGTVIAALYYDTTAITPGNVGYNLFWENTHSFSGDMAHRPDPGNLFVDPMFVDSLDFHLQAFSPAIDAGDPSLLDADGSRSDIGLFGGPFGQTYVYQNLPPASPAGLAASWQDSGASVVWLQNSESDLAAYRLYRDSFPILFADPLLLLKEATPGDTAYFDTTDLRGQIVYYRLTALDGQGNESELSDEVLVSVTSVPDDEEGVLPQEFVLFPNYPNPFNASTVISFSLPRPAEAAVIVHDVLGRRIRALVDQSFPAGKHSVVWDGTDDQRRPVASGVYFMVLRSGPELRVQKSVLLK